jgi:DME family drug/metabolite transporter
MGALCFSTTGSVRAICMPDAGALALGLIRSAGAFVLLLGICVYNGQLAAFFPMRAWLSPLSLASFLGMTGFQLCFFASLPAAGVTVATVVTIGSVPIFVGLFGWLILRERPIRIWYVATLFTLAGILFLGIGQGLGSCAGTDPVFGVVLAVGAGCCYGGFIVCSKPILRYRPPAVLMTVCLAVTTLSISVWWLISPSSMSLGWLSGGRALSGVAFLVTISTVTAYMLTLRGLCRTPVSTAATMALGEPLGAALLGIFLLGESFGFSTACGIALLFIGMMLSGCRKA